ncbi:DUF305 domain-containing protein [Streptomyces gilvus]|uniref:DUF305 domain-containing protein n=1 Tax=Streptomyces gilvus TaxID=2920937 RepID=UPI001F1075D5|nr:DUF305 domain-containing protein [Streptomyces sp. CME 23]MCH5672206.1 DUF305 domain-containing protein [Streptomyces sp. CME 23]
MRNTRTSLVRRTALTVTALTAAVTLAACGNDGGSDSGGQAAASASSSASSSAGAEAGAGAHNAQDVSFAQGMIPHHQQALEMARLAAGRASSAQVKDLAARIEKAQDPEIRTMSGWLTAWDEKVPSSGASTDSMESMPGMDHGSGSGMAGMMDPKDMTMLEKASGKDFDTMFLTMMVEHHEGAVKMAGTEQGKGSYGPAKSMAGDIVKGQTAEITEMNKLLGKS